MKVKTSELTGPALDQAVSAFVGIEYGPGFKPSTDWADGGPIIDREGIVVWGDDLHWTAAVPHGVESYGETGLIAAMRCFVRAKAGDEVEVPEELK